MRLIFDILEEGGLVSAFSTAGDMLEAIELDDHPFFISVQYHPNLSAVQIGPILYLKPLFFTDCRLCNQTVKT